GCFPIKLNRWPGHCAAGWLIGYIADHDPVPTAPLVHPGDPAAETVGSTSAQSDVGIGIAGDPRCAAVPIARLELLPWPIAHGVRSGQWMVGCRCGVLRDKSRRQNIRWRSGYTTQSRLKFAYFNLGIPYGHDKLGALRSASL